VLSNFIVNVSVIYCIRVSDWNSINNSRHAHFDSVVTKEVNRRNQPNINIGSKPISPSFIIIVADGANKKSKRNMTSH
jgi:hypothetical protein